MGVNGIGQLKKETKKFKDKKVFLHKYLPYNFLQCIVGVITSSKLSILKTIQGQCKNYLEYFLVKCKSYVHQFLVGRTEFM